MAYFHYRCGERITLLNENCTAIRNDADFDHGIVVTAEPLQNDVLFEVKIDRLIGSWSGSLEIGVTDINPLNLEFPACASKLQHGSWVMTSFSVTKNGATLIHQYGVDLDSLSQDDRVGVMRTSEGELYFYVNGESQGLAAENLPTQLYGVVDLYGQCVQVSITSPLLREHNNDDCLSGSSVLAIDNDNLNVTLGGDLSELSLSSSNSFDIRMDVNVSLTLHEEPRVDKLRFHERCGSLIKLSNGHRTAERRRPLDEFNNGVVMTHRPLLDGELFEIRIDRLVDKWSGSIEMGITTHNPSTLVFPATMTNMRSGTIMMSGCGILTNGKGTRREYGDFNLDELSEGDRVGMMRKADGNIHYFINGLDQGVAAQRVSYSVWGVIDLYGMTIKVSIVERDEREEQNLMTRRTIRDQLPLQGAPLDTSDPRLNDYHDRLTFHESCGKHAEVINNGRTAHRPTAADDFNNAVVLTARPLRPGELFQVRLDRVVTKWAGSIEIGVTTHSAHDLDFPFTMTNVRSGTWMMTGSGIMHNGTTVLEQYGVNLDRLAVGDRVGCVRHDSGLLHFYVNGVDQGCAASHVPARVYGVIDLYGQAVEATLLDGYDDHSDSQGSGARVSIGEGVGVPGGGEVLQGGGGVERVAGGAGGDFRFHYIHGSNARIINNGLTAWRPRPLAEFNDGIVFSNRPLRPGELFEISLDNIVDRWSGSVELGVTAVRPEEINLPSTATDLAKDTWMLSGSSVMENSVTILSKYPCDLDTLIAGTRIGVMINADRTLEFYCDGRSQGVACASITPTPLYAVVDLYGSCAQVSIVDVTAWASRAAIVGGALMDTSGLSCGGGGGGGGGADTPYPRSEESVIVLGEGGEGEVGLRGKAAEVDLHRFAEPHSNKVSIIENGRVAVRTAPTQLCLVYSATCLRPDELFEVALVRIEPLLAGGLAIGVTHTPPPAGGTGGGGGGDGGVNEGIPPDARYITGNEVRSQNQVHARFTPSLQWLREGDRVGVLRTSASSTCWRLLVNGEPVHHVSGPPIPTTGGVASANNMYVFVGLHGACASVAAVSRKLAVVLQRAQRDVAVPAHVNGATVSGKMQDSLDQFPLADQEQDPVSLEAPIASEELISIDNVSVHNSVKYEFHENHGRNVEVSRDRSVAMRVASYNQGVLLVEPAVNTNQLIQVVIEKIDSRWESSLIVGVICCATVAERLNLPITALGFRGTCCIISNDWICLNGVKTQSNYGERLHSVSLGSKVGIMVREDGLQLYVDGVTEDTLPWTSPNGAQPNQLTYAVFDLYGQCHQIKLINDTDDDPLTPYDDPPSPSPAPATNQDCEKADLDCNEKERVPNLNHHHNSTAPTCDNTAPTAVTSASASSVNVNTGANNSSSNLSLPLTTQVAALPAQLPRLTPVSTPMTARVLNCQYQMEVVAFKRTLFLPEEFFTNEEPSCYCVNCYKFKSQDPDALKDESLIGWVTFPLKNLRNIQTEKWHSAYYGARLAAIRKILDRGQLLTKSQLSSCHLIGADHNLTSGDDDGQVSFSPSLQRCAGEGERLQPPRNSPTLVAHTYTRLALTAFQLLVKPGAYSVALGDCAHWATKETGAVCAQALLLQLRPGVTV